jgi:hypothetical protein
MRALGYVLLVAGMLLVTTTAGPLTTGVGTAMACCGAWAAVTGGSKS